MHMLMLMLILITHLEDLVASEDASVSCLSKQIEEGCGVALTGQKPSREPVLLVVHFPQIVSAPLPHIPSHAKRGNT